MKHSKITAEFIAHYNKDAEGRVKEIIAEQIGYELLKNNLIEFSLLDSDCGENAMRGDIVAIKTSDYEKMMHYIYNLEHYRFYDREKDEEIILKDLL